MGEIFFYLGMIVSMLRRIDRKQDEFMATVKEAFAEQAQTANKIFGEIQRLNTTAQDKIRQLEAALANRDLTPEEASAFEEANTALKQADELIPDELPTEPPADTEEGEEGDEDETPA